MQEARAQDMKGEAGHPLSQQIKSNTPYSQNVAEAFPEACPSPFPILIRGTIQYHMQRSKTQFSPEIFLIAPIIIFLIMFNVKTLEITEKFKQLKNKMISNHSEQKAIF